jgi:hypothetical protein
MAVRSALALAEEALQRQEEEELRRQAAELSEKRRREAVRRRRPQPAALSLQPRARAQLIDDPRAAVFPQEEAEQEAQERQVSRRRRRHHHRRLCLCVEAQMLRQTRLRLDGRCCCCRWLRCLVGLWARRRQEREAAMAQLREVSRPCPSRNRSTSTEIYLCHACSDHEHCEWKRPGRHKRASWAARARRRRARRRRGRWRCSSLRPRMSRRSPRRCGHWSDMLCLWRWVALPRHLHAPPLNTRRMMLTPTPTPTPTLPLPPMRARRVHVGA